MVTEWFVANDATNLGVIQMIVALLLLTLHIAVILLRERKAKELNRTPSAVIHGIQSLEAWLGVQLFARGNRSLILSGAGASYLPQVRIVLEHLAQATEAVCTGRSGRLITASGAAGGAKSNEAQGTPVSLPPAI